jgi:hypothetical protein
LNDLDDEDDSTETVVFKPTDKDLKGKKEIPIINFGTLSSSLHKYDSSQNELPASQKDGFVESTLKRKLIHIKERFDNKDESIVDEFFDGFKSNLPNVIILLLPLFALVLKLLYIRRKFFYVEHLIFSIHIHCFAFLLFSIWLLGEFFFPTLEDYFFWIILLFLFYTCLAMKTMFSQSWLRTFVKFIFLGMTYTIILLSGLVFNFLLSAYLMA